MDSTKKIISDLRIHLNGLPVDAELLTKLGGKNLLPDTYVKRMTKLVEDQKMPEASRDLIAYISDYYDVEMLKEFCTCLEKISKDARPALKRYADIIRNGIEEANNTDEDLQNSTKKRKVDVESVDDILDSGFPCESTPIFTGREYQQPEGKAETKTEIAWKWYSTPFGLTCCSATACDDAVYVMAKGDNKMKADNIYTYNQSTKVWTEIEKPPGSITSFSIASLGNDLHLTGGKVKNQANSERGLNQVKTWNITEQKWEEELPNMQEGRFCHGSGSFSDYLVVVGGIHTYSIEIINCNTVENKVWVKVISLPKSLVWPHLAASNKHLYFGFGYTDTIPQPSNYLAVLMQDKLVEAFKSEKTMDLDCIEELPLPPHELPALAVIGNKPVALGGRIIDDEKHKPESSVSECYILVDHKTWAPLQKKMKSSRCNACVATVSDGIVVMGGTTIPPQVSYYKPQSSNCSAVEKAQIV